MPISPPISRLALALLRSDAIRLVQKITGHHFKDQQLPWEAMQAYRNDHFPYRNGRLAHVGDAVLKLILIDDGFRRGLSPGEQYLCNYNIPHPS